VGLLPLPVLEPNIIIKPNTIEMYTIRLLTSMAVSLLLAMCLCAQEPVMVPNTCITKMHQRTAAYEQKITRQTARYLRRLEKQELKLAKKLHRLDSGKAAELFAATKEKYQLLRNSLSNPAVKVTKLTGKYLPNVDSMGLALNFLGQNNQYLNAAKNSHQKISDAVGHFNKLKQQLKNTGDIEKYISERKRLLKETLRKYGLQKHLKKFSKESYYAIAQFNEYKQALNNTQAFEKKALELLNKIPAFREFAKTNGLLGNLFAMPAANGGAPNLAGLQTRASVNAAIHNQLTASGPNAMQQLQQNLQQAQTQLTQLKDKILKAGGQSSDFDIPDFKVNHQRTKSFWQRLSFTADVQPVKGNRLLPNGMDVGLGLTYQPDDKKIIGAQLVYKAGVGNSLRHIKLSHQGVGYRFYADVKLKASIWASAGFEQQYLHVFSKITELKNTSAWQTNALAGISKKYKLGKKKGGEMKLLYDFLWSKQVNGQRIVWRTGFRF
jgi:hypothetical protein